MIVPNAYAQTQSTTLVLDPFSSSANLGETITFSGKLTSNGNGVSGAIVNIMDEDLLDDIVDELDDETGFDLEVEDLTECSASLYYNFGDGNVSVKAALYASDGVQELIEEKTNISTSEFSYELTMKFDDSGDNTIHVILRSLLTIIDEAGGVGNMERMMYNLDRMF